MGLFNRHKLKLEDTNLLMIEWKDKDFPKSSEVQSIIEQIDEQLKDSLPQPLSESLPYLTFNEAELFFSAIRDAIEGDNAIEIGRVSLANWAEGKKPTTKGEVFIEDLVISPNFTTIMKPLTEAIFNNKAFAEFTYEEKTKYFQDSIFTSYQESTGHDATWLPMLPSEEEAKYGKVDVVVPHFVNSQREAKNQEQAQSEAQAAAQREAQAQAEAQRRQQQAQVAAEQERQRQQATLAQAKAAPEDDGGSLLDEMALGSTGGQSQSQTTSSAPIRQVPTTNQSAPLPSRQERNRDLKGSIEIHFPRFEVANFEKATYQPYEDEYVAWQLNNQCKEYNRQLQEAEDTNNHLADQSLQQKLRAFEQLQYSLLRKQLADADHRKGLKKQVVQEIKKQQSKVLSDELERLVGKRDQALAEEEQRYQNTVKSIQDNFEQTQAETKTNIQQKTLELANSTYQERNYSATGELQKKLDLGLADIAKAKSVKQDSLIEELETVGRNLGAEEYQIRQSRLKQIRAKLKADSEYAKRVHLVERQEALHQNRDEDVSKVVSELRDHLSAAERQRQETEARNQDLSQKLLDTREQVLDVKTQKLKEASSPVVIDAPTPSHAKKSNFLRRILLGTAAALILIGCGLGVGVYVHHQSTAQAARVAKLADTQAKLSKSLKSTKKENAALKSKATAASKKAQSSSATDKTQKALDDMSSDLRALLDRPVYVQSGNTSASSSSSSK